MGVPCGHKDSWLTIVGEAIACKLLVIDGFVDLSAITIFTCTEEGLDFVGRENTFREKANQSSSVFGQGHKAGTQ